MTGNKEGGDVAAEGRGAETRTSAPKTRPTGDHERKELGPHVCSCCGHPQRWSNVHMVEAVLLLKEYVVGRTVETVRWWEVARLDSSTTPAAL